MFWRRPHSDFSAEIESHIALETDRLIAEGMSPDEARTAATRRFGNVASTKERFYESRRILWLDHLRQDLRHAVRTLMHERSFAFWSILTLALGIGANTAIFSIVHAVLLDPLPYQAPERLVRIIQNIPAERSIDARPRRALSMDLDELVELRRRTQAFDNIAMYDSSAEITLQHGADPLRVVRTSVSPSLFPTIGVPAFLGRTFSEEEARPGSPDTVLLSHRAWSSYFARDPRILDRKLTLNGRSFAVIGVMPEAFAFPDPQTEFWTPVVMRPLARGEIRALFPVARLKNGIEPAAAAAEVNTILRNVRENHPEAAERVFVPPHVDVVRIQDELVAPVRPALLVLLAAVGVVLLIACSNVANLLLARSSSRQGDIAIRAALGASRGRLIRQTLTESCLLSVLGGLAGTALAFAGVRILVTTAPADIPRLDAIGIDLTVLAFTLGVSVLAGLVFGTAPALHASRVNHNDTVKAAGGTKGSARNRTGRLIIVAEIALAVVLLTGGGLLIRSFLKLSSVHPGFDPANVLMFQVALPQPLNINALNESLTEDLVSRLQTLPGAQAVAFANALPLVPRTGYTLPRILGTPLPVEGAPQVRVVSRSYIAAMGMRLVEGRDFGENDRAGQAPAAIVSRAMVRYFGGDSPVGKTITVGGVPTQIVGVVEDIHEQALNIEPRPQVYLDSRQGFGRETDAFALNWAFFVVRADRALTAMAPDIREIVRQVIPGATLRLNIGSMQQVLSNSVARPRLYALLLGLFGAVAVVLAMVGVYGITAYSVAGRTREIGIRVAVGARPGQVLALLLSQTVVLSATGIVIGIGGAIAVTRYLEGLLFGVTPLDPVTFFFVPAGFVFVALLASYLPARRAIKVDPLIALRHE